MRFISATRTSRTTQATRAIGALTSAAAVAVAVAVGSSCSSRPSDPTLARGQEVFEQNCAACHGDKGEGKNAPALIGVARTFPDVKAQIAVITNGRSTMPAWQGRLSAADIAAVAAYTRTL